MRASDRKLYEALTEAGLPGLAERAKRGEWNDFFGIHGMPRQHLFATLRHVRNIDTRGLQERVLKGDFDGTKEEADEWALSSEGQEVFSEFDRR